MSDDIGKIPPQAIDMEEAVIGAILLEKNSIYMVTKMLTPESFYKPAHMKIYKAAIDMFANSEPIDLLTVTNKLRERGELEGIGGAFAVTELTSKVNSAAHIEYHAAIIKEAWLKREIIKMSDRLNVDSYRDDLDALSLLDRSAAEVNSIIEHIYKNKSHDLKQIGYEVIEKATHNATGHSLIGVPSGMLTVDRFTSGWKSPDLIVIAARPSMGKTAFVLQCAVNAATQFDKSVAVFSLEMSVEQCMQRLLSTTAQIDLSKIIKGQVSQHEKLRLENLGQKITDSKLHIDDSAALTIIELRAKCHVIRNEHGLELIIVDYLQLMEAEGKTREQEIAKISRGLKALAKEFDCPVIALSQLSRAVEARGGTKRPMLADLRESGAIEQDADMVGFLYRPEYYKINEMILNGQTTNTANLGLLIWEKNRNGPIDEFPLKFIGKYTKFQDWDNIKLEDGTTPQLLDYTVPVKDQDMPKPPF